MDKRDIPSYNPPPSGRAVEACKISLNCQKDTSYELQPSSRCDTNDLNCICAKDSSLNDNKYFNSHCLFQECTDTDARQEFMRAFLAACARSNQQALKIPAEWAPFLPTDQSRTTQQPSSTTNVARSEVASSNPSTPSTSSMSTMSGLTTTFPVTTMTQATPVSQDVARPSSTNWADIQKPICAITEDCLVNKDKIDPCGLENLQCVCKYSNSIADNKYFDQNCLYATCYTDLGRREWMDAFAYACYEANKTLADINDQWRPYIPTWYPISTKTPSGNPSPTTSASTTATIITGAPTTTLSEGAIAGIAVGAIGAVIIMAICGFFFWRAKKKLKRKSREVAQMADALQHDGVQRRIDELRYGSESHDSLSAVGVAKSTPGHQGVYGQYNPASHGEGEYISTVPPPPPPPHMRGPRDRVNSLGTTAITGAPNDIYVHPAEYEQGVGGYRAERRTDTHASQDSLGTTAVTTSPVQRYSHDADGNGNRSRPATYDEYGHKITYR